VITYSYINRLEQFGSLDVDLVIFDDDKEVNRVHKSFKKVYDTTTLDKEADKEVELLKNPLPPVEQPKSEVELLKETIVGLEAQIVTKDAEIVELKKPKVIDEVIL
jgi:hypothetical protein